MTKKKLTKSEKNLMLQKELLYTLLKSSPPMISEVVPDQITWLTTRQLADSQNISIYKARLLLLAMADKGLIIVSDKRINNKLRWYPSKVGSIILESIM